MRAKYRRRSALRQILLPLLILAALGSAAWAGWNWYDNNVDRSGWVQEDSSIQYKDFHGKFVTGWQQIDGRTYFFREDHSLVFQWHSIGPDRFYFGDDGVLRTGWQTIDENRYYFDNRGAMISGWLTLEGRNYFLREGILQTDWQEIEGETYRFTDAGEMLTGWQEIESKTYLFREDGIMVTGLAALDGCNYCFLEDGSMHTGWWETEDGKTYYLPEGPQAFGWTEIEDKRYFFAEDGVMLTGWLQEGEYSYYLQEDGSAAVGPTQIGSDTYFFTPKGIHVVLVNASHPVPDYYEVNLVTVTGWHQVADVCLDPLVRMLADCNAAGISYTFNSAHRTIAEQTTILELRTEEHMATGMSYNAARAKALQTVARPGTSEHHLGLAVDLLGNQAIAWLTEHCWDYGFIVRYTAEKYPITGIINEPWHFRYVGTEVSLDMKDSGLCLEEYLGAA